jgi:3-methylfumaryl-CoA hydratase
MTALDVSALRRHIGTRIVDEDVATEAPLEAIVATFDREEDAPCEGEAIPPGWHIGYFLSTARTATLAADGLPAGTGVLPKLPLPRRMYAGTRITFHAPLRVGDRLRRETELTDLQVREGGTGTLIVTTQTRRISTSRGLAIIEDYDTVFREEVKPGAKSGIPKRDEVPANLPWRRIRTFSMRARAPLFDTAPFDLVGRPTEGGAACEVWAVAPGGTIAMQASATFD